MFPRNSTTDPMKAEFNVVDVKQVEAGNGNRDEGERSVVNNDSLRVLGLVPDEADFYIGFSAERRRRVVRKVSPIILVAPKPACHLVQHSIPTRSTCALFLF